MLCSRHVRRCGGLLLRMQHGLFSRSFHGCMVGGLGLLHGILCRRRGILCATTGRIHGVLKFPQTFPQCTANSGQLSRSKNNGKL